MMRRIGMLALALALFSAPAVQAEWALDPASSGIYFVSTKAGKIAEVHQFRQLQGTVGDDGKARIDIELASVDTGIKIRDERMQEHLFETALHPRAQIWAELDLRDYLALPAGGMRDDQASFAVTLHGVRESVDVEYTVIRLDDQRFVVASRKPVVIGAAMFGLQEGLDKLQEIAGLPSISPAVSVTFQLGFTAR